MVHGGDSTLPRPRAVGNRHRGRCDASVVGLAHLGLRRGWLKPLALSPHACAFLSTGSISGRDPIAREAKAAMRTHMPRSARSCRDASLGRLLKSYVVTAPSGDPGELRLLLAQRRLPGCPPKLEARVLRPSAKQRTHEAMAFAGARKVVYGQALDVLKIAPARTLIGPICNPCGTTCGIAPSPHGVVNVPDRSGWSANPTIEHPPAASSVAWQANGRWSYVDRNHRHRRRHRPLSCGPGGDEWIARSSQARGQARPGDH